MEGLLGYKEQGYECLVQGTPVADNWDRKELPKRYSQVVSNFQVVCL